MKPPDSQSFVLCPGKAYDRSPCGTGTSAKLACLYSEDGKLQKVRYGGKCRRRQHLRGQHPDSGWNRIIPTITGEAWVMSEGTIC
jgi:4-hydroxyproline epimerase